MANNIEALDDNNLLDLLVNIKKGDEINIIGEVDHNDLNVWLDEQNNNIFIVKEFDLEAALVWIEDCPYAISVFNVAFANVRKAS